MTEVFPIILSGGGGTRLWPLSRLLYPKQYIDLGGETLFGECLDRLRALQGAQAKGLYELRPPIVVCNQEHRFLAASILRHKGWDTGAGADRAGLILEPEGRNTAPAVALAALAAGAAAKGDPLLLVLPSDHKIALPEVFAACVCQAVQAASSGLLLTFGVTPESPAAAYGYILQGRRLDGVWAVERFVEKPSVDAAEALLKQGGCFWNSGMFIFRASVFLEELRRLAPAVLAGAAAAWEKRSLDLDFIRVDADSFAAAPNLSIDYALMERTDKAAMLPLDAGWRDLGSWEAMGELAPGDDLGNSFQGDVELLDCSDTYIHAASRLVAGIGLRGMLVVESPDAVLVMPKGRGQEVKRLVDALKAENRVEAETHLLAHRPWGTYETLARGDRFQVKRILVRRGASLSLQLHHHRAEHWVVVRGTARVVLEDKEFLLSENQSVYIPVGSRHRLENPGRIDLELIEIQSGAYLGEDDIVRFQDDYGRFPDNE